LEFDEFSCGWYTRNFASPPFLRIELSVAGSGSDLMGKANRGPAPTALLEYPDRKWRAKNGKDILTAKNGHAKKLSLVNLIICQM
jgi:hypothetical protein